MGYSLIRCSVEVRVSVVGRKVGTKSKGKRNVFMSVVGYMNCRSIGLRLDFGPSLLRAIKLKVGSYQLPADSLSLHDINFQVILTRRTVHSKDPSSKQDLLLGKRCSSTASRGRPHFGIQSLSRARSATALRTGLGTLRFGDLSDVSGPDRSVSCELTTFDP